MGNVCCVAVETDDYTSFYEMLAEFARMKYENCSLTGKDMRALLTLHIMGHADAVQMVWDDPRLLEEYDDDDDVNFKAKFITANHLLESNMQEIFAAFEDVCEVGKVKTTL